jgi:23S rRNA (cytidine2498-2'-O)-methyltransferase
VPQSFGRAFGRSLGRASGVADVLAWWERLGEGRVRLHVFERDPDRPADERDARAGSRAAALEAELRAAAPVRFLEGRDAQLGDVVLDVIVAAGEEPDDGIFVGWHRDDRDHGPEPGGVSHALIPPEAPSRAWAKIEESVRWSRLAPRAGENVLELGAAPGGMSLALLARGANVYGVDPGAIAPDVLRYRGPHENRFVYLRKPAAEVERTELPRPMHWLISDMNLAPMVALRYIERFVALGRGQLRGAFLTLKVHDEGIFEALPGLMKRIDSLGARAARYTQLPSHRSELVAILEF